VNNGFSVCNVVSRCALLAFMALALQIARADTYNVNTTADLPDDGGAVSACHTSAGTCSLRAAIMKANQADGSSVIHVPAGMYLLTIPPSGSDGDDTGDLNLASPVGADQEIQILGEDAATTIIDGNHMDGVITVEPTRRAYITGVTIRNGVSDLGGGILFNFAGPSIITFCVIEDNRADLGGGVLITGGPLVITGTTIRSNVAANLGGGLYLGGPTSIHNSTLNDNGAEGIDDVEGEGGGGIFSNSDVYIVDSTLSGNYANANGGGIRSIGTAFLYNTSVIGNDADHDHDMSGGIGGGVYAAAGSRFGVVNTLIASNTVAVFTENNCDGALEAYGMNLLDERDGCTTTTSDSNLGFVSPSSIGPLQDNGGDTWTHALLPGSEAIDNTIDSLGCVDEIGAPLTIDQRGAPRVIGARCDVGAFEYALADLIFQGDFEP